MIRVADRGLREGMLIGLMQKGQRPKSLLDHANSMPAEAVELTVDGA